MTTPMLTLVLPFSSPDQELALGLSVLLAENLSVPGQDIGLAAIFQREDGSDEAARPVSVPLDERIVSALSPRLRMRGQPPDTIVTGELLPPGEGGGDGLLRLGLFDTGGRELHRVEASLPADRPVPALTSLFSALFDEGTELDDTPDDVSWGRLSQLASAVSVFVAPADMPIAALGDRYRRALDLALGAVGQDRSPFDLALRKLVALCNLAGRQPALDPQVAAETLQTAVARVDETPLFLAAAGQALLGLGRGADGHALARRAVELDPHVPGAWRALLETTATEQGGHAAVALACEQLEVLRTMPELLDDIGRLLEQHGRHDEAAALWEEGALRRPDLWRAPTQLGMLARSRGDHEQARHWFRYATTHAEDPRVPLRLLAEDLLPRRRHHGPELLRLLDALLAREPDNAWAMAQHGMTLLALGRLEEGSRQLEAVIADAPGTRWQAEAEKELFALAEPTAWTRVRRAYRLCAEGDPMKGLIAMAATLDGPRPVGAAPGPGRGQPAHGALGRRPAPPGRPPRPLPPPRGPAPGGHRRPRPARRHRGLARPGPTGPGDRPPRPPDPLQPRRRPAGPGPPGRGRRPGRPDRATGPRRPPRARAAPLHSHAAPEPAATRSRRHLPAARARPRGPRHPPVAAPAAPARAGLTASARHPTRRTMTDENTDLIEMIAEQWRADGGAHRRTAHSLRATLERFQRVPDARLLALVYEHRRALRPSSRAYLWRRMRRWLSADGPHASLAQAALRDDWLTSTPRVARRAWERSLRKPWQLARVLRILEAASGRVPAAWVLALGPALTADDRWAPAWPAWIRALKESPDAPAEGSPDAVAIGLFEETLRRRGAPPASATGSLG